MLTVGVDDKDKIFYHGICDMLCTNLNLEDTEKLFCLLR